MLLCPAVPFYSHLLLKDFPRRKWIYLFASRRHFLLIFAIFSQVGFGICQIVWQQAQLSVRYGKKHSPLFAFLTWHLMISFDTLGRCVFTKITASFLFFPHATLCFMELCPRFPQPFSAFPAPHSFPLGCTEVHPTLRSKMRQV